MSKKKDYRNPCEMIFKWKLDCITYWNILEIIRDNIFMNICMGGRGIGKTEQSIGWSLNNFKDTGEEFIYCRRFKTECAGSKDICSNWLDDVKFIGDRNGGGQYHWHGNRLGYNIPLSVASNYKSGFDFSKVTTIIYDEAIINPTGMQHYLHNEVEALLELCSTVFRHRTNVRVIVLGNNLVFFNPFCEFFNIKVMNGKYVDRERSIKVMYSKDSAKLRKIEEDTPLFKLTKGTPYHDYHYNNTVFTDKNITVKEKHNNDKIFIRLRLNSYTLNMYTRGDGKLLCESKNRLYDDGITMEMLVNNEPNYYNVGVFRDNWYKMIFYKYYNNEIDYTSQDAYNLLQEFLVLF